MNNISTFQIDCLDHVAIRVKDIEKSAQWYEKVLGLERYEVPEWGDFPVFLLAKTTGIALFPVKNNYPKLEPISKNVKIDHFAFRLTKENFDLAIKKYEELGVEYSFQDHHYFHSIYTKDPDGHTVELTTLLVRPEAFYKLNNNNS